MTPGIDMPTKILLTMPQPGETITQGTVVSWLVPEGATVSEGDRIVELETEKAVFEYESPYEGKLIEILARNGSVVPVGNPIAVFEVPDEKASLYFMLGIGKKVEVRSQESEVRSHEDTVLPGKLSPLIRNLMREYGIDFSELGQVHGTGPGGRITKENILTYLAAKKGEAEAAPADVDLIPLSPLRMRIAENMTRSHQTVPQAHTGLSIDLTRILERRGEASILSLIFPSLKEAILKVPVVNASFRDLKGIKSIALHKKIHLGVAIDVGKGLYLVVVRNTDEKSAKTFERELKALVERAKEDKLAPADLTGMTFTFNNYGYYGSTMAVQIILPPQSTTLGMGKIEARPWVVDGKIEIRQVADFTLAFDHRVLDGREAGQFLATLKRLLEGS